MILCQTCFHEAPDGAAHCPACGEPLAAPVFMPRPVRNTQHPAPSLRQNLEALYPAGAQTPVQASAQASAQATPATLPQPTWQVFGPTTGGNAPPVEVPTLSFQFPSGETYTLSGKRTFVIGREDTAAGTCPDLDLTHEGGMEAGVSRNHAAIHVRPDGYFIEDLGSANDTLLNAQRLLPRQMYALHSGDQVRFALLNALVVISG